MIKWVGMIRFALCLILAIAIMAFTSLNYATGIIEFGWMALAVVGALGLIMAGSGVFR